VRPPRGARIRSRPIEFAPDLLLRSDLLSDDFENDMTFNSSSFWKREKFVLAVVCAATFSACSGGGSGGGSASGGSSSFRFVETNLNQNQPWQINRAMVFEFSKPVDFSSVNLNTISVARVGGAPASGSFSLSDPNTVVFQPTCPTEDNFTDAGLQPGGLRYIVNLVSSTTGGATVRSVDGDSLSLGLTVEIVTPDSDNLAVLFDDVQGTPPLARIWLPTPGEPAPQTGGFSYIEEGNDPTARFVFQTRTMGDSAALGAEVSVPDYEAPLNLYSISSSAVGIVLEIDQPVDPSASNINPETVRLEYCSLLNGACGSGAEGWIDIAHSVDLVANCSNGGAQIRVTPIGILPLGRVVRVSMAASFRDIVGQGNLLDLPVASFRVADTLTADAMPGDPLQDEFFEPFTIPGGTAGSSQDTEALLDAPAATWGESGTLAAGFSFGGTGGPGGDFDWRIVPLAGGSATVLSTDFSIIQNNQQTATQTIVGGVIDVRDLFVEAGSLLEIRGTKACVIRASGNVVINGRVQIRGTSSRGVVTFSTTGTPEPGAAGQAGGGRGGTGNILTMQSTPVGEAGYGAFGQLGGGGGGGETGYNSGVSIELRRGAGGGGGTLGRAMTWWTPTAPFNENSCPDQRIIGLDAEDGNPGALQASGAISGPGQRPRGGLKGPGPFLDTNPNNDFFGLMRAGNSIIRGELGQAWAGAGGGGGGNSVNNATFPNPMWTTAGDEKGAGGGGGGGSLTILCLGNVTFGPNGRIDAGGGTGGGGENTNGTNRVGGGSGGGAGGHVIVQVGGRIDFSQVRTNQAFERDKGGIWTRGGQGGEGSAGPNATDGQGGAGPNSVETTPLADRLPRDHYVLERGGLTTPAPCAFAATNPNNTAQGPAAAAGSLGEGIPGCGGDGGPGVIQLHAPTLGDIFGPVFGGESLFACLKPNPVGTFIRAGVGAANNASNVNNPAQWDQLLPGFGKLSKAQSKWIALGATSISPTSTDPETTEFRFDGVDAAGLILKAGGGTSATQAELPSILSGTGSQTVTTAPSTPFITADKRAVVFDGTTVLDDVYLSNPALLRAFDVRFVVGTSVFHFDASSATYDETSGLLRVFVAESGMPLNGIPTTGSASVSIRPRFFRVRTSGTQDALPDPVQIKFEFQATSVNSVGEPDEAAATPWVTDINALNTDPGNTAMRFFRFRVSFDLGTSTLSANSPIPSIEFLRVPFRF